LAEHQPWLPVVSLDTIRQENNARVRIVYLEVPESDLFAQNRARSRPVPSDPIVRLLDRWAVPDLTEAHALEWVVRTGDGKTSSSRGS
jgi:tRNA uridine 5-carbamoylmethylation protein Kti12